MNTQTVDSVTTTGYVKQTTGSRTIAGETIPAKEIVWDRYSNIDAYIRQQNTWSTFSGTYSLTWNGAVRDIYGNPYDLQLSVSSIQYRLKMNDGQSTLRRPYVRLMGTGATNNNHAWSSIKMYGLNSAGSNWSKVGGISTNSFGYGSVRQKYTVSILDPATGEPVEAGKTIAYYFCDLDTGQGNTYSFREGIEPLSGVKSPVYTLPVGETMIETNGTPNQIFRYNGASGGGSGSVASQTTGIYLLGDASEFSFWHYSQIGAGTSFFDALDGYQDPEDYTTSIQNTFTSPPAEATPQVQKIVTDRSANESAAEYDWEFVLEPVSGVLSNGIVLSKNEIPMHTETVEATEPAGSPVISGLYLAAAARASYDSLQNWVSGRASANDPTTAYFREAVYYDDLTPGVSYQVRGRILTESAGTDITGEQAVRFIPEKPNGVVYIDFSVRRSALIAGTDIYGTASVDIWNDSGETYEMILTQQGAGNDNTVKVMDPDAFIDNISGRRGLPEVVQNTVTAALEKDRVMIRHSGTASFRSIRFKKPGTYTYMIYEDINDDDAVGYPGYTVDDSYILASYTVTQTGSTLTAEPSYTRVSGGVRESVDGISFNNVYEPSNYSLRITKTGVNDMSYVWFVLASCHAGTIAYYTLTPGAAEGAYSIRSAAADISNATRISPDDAGNILISGFAEGDYYLEEVHTEEGYGLPEPWYIHLEKKSIYDQSLGRATVFQEEISSEMAVSGNTASMTVINTPEVLDFPVSKSVTNESGTDIHARTVAVGDTLYYNVTVENPFINERRFYIEDYLPNYTEYVAYSADSGGTFTDRKVSWTVDIPAGLSRTVSFAVRTKTADVRIDNQATVSLYRSSGTELAASKVTNIVTNYTFGDVITKSVKDASGTDIDHKTVADQSILYYEVTVSNPADITKTYTVKDVIPENTVYIEGSADNGGTYASGIVTWTFDMPAGAEKTLKFRVKADGEGVKIRNWALLYVDDVTISSNWVYNSTPKKPVKKVYDHKNTDMDGKYVETGDVLTYRIIVENAADEDKEFTVTDVLPDGVTFRSADNGGTCSEGTVTWNVTVPAESAKTLSVSAVVNGTAAVMDNEATQIVDSVSMKSDTVSNYRAVITINKTISNYFSEFGEPTFIYRITDSHGNRWVRSITIDDPSESTGGSGTAVFEVPAGVSAETYTIVEEANARYRCVNVSSPSANVRCEPAERSAAVTIDPDHNTAAVSYKNEIRRWDEVSHAAGVINHIPAE